MGAHSELVEEPLENRSRIGIGPVRPTIKSKNRRDIGKVIFKKNRIKYGQEVTTANLAGEDLSWTQLVNVNFSSAKLSGANFTFANMTNGNLSLANLTGADLTNAILSRGNLDHANLTGVRAVYANFTYASLLGANCT